jgi:hypothetical protein
MQLNNQKGIAAIIITIIMSLVLTLIALGFTQVSLAQQKDALNSALSTQAFYSAESGVNYEIHQIISNPTSYSSATSTTNTSCQTYTSSVNDLKIGSTQNQWTCLMVNFHPTNLIYNVQNNSAVLIPIKSNQGPIKYLNLSWRDHPYSGSGNNFNSCQSQPNKFVKALSYRCPASVLQVSVLPGQDINSASSQPNTYYLSPSYLSPSYFNQSNWSNGQNSLVQCSSSSSWCNASIPVSGSTIPSTSKNNYQYYLYVVPLYSATKLYVSASFNAQPAEQNPNGYQLYNAQAQIDSTGKGYNVLKRILVTVNTGIGGLNLNNLNTHALFALQTGGSICKQLLVNENTNNVKHECS